MNMALKIINAQHPKTRCTTSAKIRADGKYELADGTVVDEIQQDSGSAFPLVVVMGYFVFLIIRDVIRYCL